MALKTYENFLLTQARALSLCCCFEEDTIYWEAVPCDMTSRLRRGGQCAEWDQCQYQHRQFLGLKSSCMGTESKVCECQRFTLSSYATTGTPGTLSNSGFFLRFRNTLSTSSTIDWQDNQLIITTVNESRVYNFSDPSLTIQTLQSFGGLPVGIDLIEVEADPNLHLGAVFPKQVTLGQNDTDDWFFRAPGLRFFFGGQISDTAFYDEDPEDFRQNIESTLQSFIGGDIEVVLNPGSNSPLWGFEVLFEGDLCGRRHENLLATSFVIDFSPLQLNFEYGDYQTGQDYLLNNNDYFITGTGIPCGYELADAGGPLAFDPNIRCCPQRGTTLGPPQLIGFEQVFDITGYNKDDLFGLGRAWSNMETTVVLNTPLSNKCFTVSPNWFTFGKAGRLLYNYSWDKALHIPSTCTWGTLQTGGNCVKNDGAPNNCTAELFIPMFHKNVPWGPFGAYYDGIEGDNTIAPQFDVGTHKAWKFPYNTIFNPAGGISYLSDNFGRRYGYDYRPVGNIKTQGEWRETKRIKLEAAVRRLLPFYVGTTAGDDLDYFMSIAEGSVPSGWDLTYPSGKGCGPFVIEVEVSGQTVGDFLDDVNNLEFEDYSDCPPFSFCAGSPDARLVPLKKVNNVSSELWQQQRFGASTDLGGDGPDVDSEKWSGSDILVVPLSYHDMHKGSDFNISPGQVSLAYQNPHGGPVTAKTPPIANLITNISQLREMDASQLRDSDQMWWNQINGSIQPIIYVERNPSATLESFSRLWVSVSGTQILIEGSGENIYQSGIVETDKGGEEYTRQECVDDINNILFTRQSSPFDDYQPVVATTGSQTFPIWLDDSTYDDGAGGNLRYGPSGTLSPTEFNYSYKEPLEPLDRVNLLPAGGRASLTSWVRDRVGQFDEIKPYCLPPSALRKGDSQKINCSGDESIIKERMVSFGCGGERCKTEWFVKGERCGCDTVYRCFDNGPQAGTEVQHPYNKEHEVAEAQGPFRISQPIVYVCEENFHPECDHRMLVKPTFQIELLDDIDPDGCDLIEAGTLAYQNGAFGTFLRLSELNWTSVLSSCLPGNIDYCENVSPQIAALSAAAGWCQHINPGGGMRVKKEDIPRVTPSNAIVVPRNPKAFCSTRPWNFDPREAAIGPVLYGLNYACKNDAGGCDPASHQGYDCLFCDEWPCPNCFNWDRFDNAIIYLEEEESPAVMTVLVRPLIKDLTAGEVCDTDDCDRWDVSCETACCECFPTCNEADGCIDQISKHPYLQLSVIQAEKSEDFTIQCDFSFEGFCLGEYSCAIQGFRPTAATGGNCTKVTTYLGGRIEGTCGCVATGGITQKIENCITDCGCIQSDYPTEPCDPIGPFVPIIPDPAPPIPYACSTFTIVPPSEKDCGNPQRAGNRLGINCLTNVDFQEDTCVIETTGFCNYNKIEWEQQIDSFFSGTSPIDSAQLGIFDQCDFHTNLQLEYDGFIERETAQFTNCPTFGPGGGEYEVVVNFFENVTMRCDISNEVVATGMLESDPNFVGITGC